MDVLFVQHYTSILSNIFNISQVPVTKHSNIHLFFI